MSQTATEIMPRLRCDVSLRNEDGITAVELAEQLNQAEVLALLQRQNTKQGLGFTVGYRVMDLKTLGNILGGIGGVASSLKLQSCDKDDAGREKERNTSTCFRQNLSNCE